MSQRWERALVNRRWRGWRWRSRGRLRLRLLCHAACLLLLCEFLLLPKQPLLVRQLLLP